MVEPGPSFPCALEAGCFFGRLAERQRLRVLARNLSRGAGRSFVLHAPDGAGKSEFLRQSHAQLFHEGEIFPFFYAFPRIGWELKAFAGDFFTQFATQYLAFRRRDPSLAGKPLQPEPLLSRLRADGSAGGDLLAETARLLETLPPERSPALEASLLPPRFAAATGQRVLSLLDDVANISGYLPSAQLAWAGEAFSSRIAPGIFACRDPGEIEELFGSGGGPAAVSAWHLGPLSEDAAGQLLQYHLRTAGMEMDEAARAALLRQTGGFPFYLHAMVRALADLASVGIREMRRAYAASVCDGELARYWRGRLAAAVPDHGLRRTALEVLAYCLREETTAPEVGLLGGLMFKSRRDVEDAVDGLCRAGIVRLDCARIFLADDPVFRDFVWALYRREFGGAEPGAVAAALVAEKVRGGLADDRRRERELLRAALRELLGAWQGQEVPAILFKAGAWKKRYGDVTGEALIAALKADRGRVTLPEVVAVTSGRIGQGSSPAKLELDALAWAFRAGAVEPEVAEVAWVARYLPGGEGSENQVEEFERTAGALQAAGDLPATRLVKWAILGAMLDAPGAGAATRYGMKTSTLAEVRALAELLQVHIGIPAPAAPAPIPPAMEFEMTIPMVSDTELVAARALEQLAENLRIGPQEIGRIKMALVEACINAFEHSGVREGRVRLLFSVAGGDLRIRVENRGRRLDAFSPQAAEGAEDRRKRGWGLTLIRELMDDVAFEPREDGVSLIMVKHLDTERPASE